MGVSLDANGGFFAVWERYSVSPGFSSDLLGQLFRRSGQPQGQETLLRAGATQFLAAQVGGSPAGLKVVAWVDEEASRADQGIRAVLLQAPDAPDLGQRFGVLEAALVLGVLLGLAALSRHRSARCGRAAGGQAQSSQPVP